MAELCHPGLCCCPEGNYPTIKMCLTWSRVSFEKNSKPQKSVLIFVDWLIHICIDFPIYFANFSIWFHLFAIYSWTSVSQIHWISRIPGDLKVYNQSHLVVNNEVWLYIYTLLFIVCYCRSSPDSAGGDKSDSIKNSNSYSASALFQMLVPLMKCENIDMRDTIVNGLGYTNPAVFR